MLTWLVGRLNGFGGKGCSFLCLFWDFGGFLVQTDGQTDYTATDGLYTVKKACRKLLCSGISGLNPVLSYFLQSMLNLLKSQCHSHPLTELWLNYCKSVSGLYQKFQFCSPIEVVAGVKVCHKQLRKSPENDIQSSHFALNYFL